MLFQAVFEFKVFGLKNAKRVHGTYPESRKDQVRREFSGRTP